VVVHNGPQLTLDRCPHCGISAPSLNQLSVHQPAPRKGGQNAVWTVYGCAWCGGVVMTRSNTANHQVVAKMWPDFPSAPDELPQRARDFLNQAMASSHAPAGAVVLCASAVDAMLKAKGYKEGKLYARISEARRDNLITQEMADWAHEVRLDANDQRHADEEAPLPNEADAAKSVLFTKALGEFLYVLPARVARERRE